jgi:DNA-binding transcriptional LysR family regulator
VVTPLASPAFVREHGPFDRPEDLEGLPLLRSPLEPWRTWFPRTAWTGPSPARARSFNDIGLMCDAQRRHGRGLVRLKLGAPWLENGTLVRLFATRTVPSPHAHYLCWRTGAMDRWECAAFAEWLRNGVRGIPLALILAPSPFSRLRREWGRSLAAGRPLFGCPSKPSSDKISPALFPSAAAIN